MAAAISFAVAPPLTSIVTLPTFPKIVRSSPSTILLVKLALSLAMDGKAAGKNVELEFAS